jgi:peroxiredoxin
MNHLPGFLTHHEDIKAKGVDDIAVISVNDVWVMHQWAKETDGKDKIHFLADGSAAFTKAVGLDIDLGAAGMGVRSQRYSMIVDNGTVTDLNIEEKPGVADLSGAAAILKKLETTPFKVSA